MNRYWSTRNSILGLSPVTRCLAILIVVGGVLVGTAAAVDPFTVVLLPDTQHYTEMANNPSNPFRVQTTWIANNMAEENIAFVTHMGDIVQSNNTTPSQWEVADTACDILEAANVPYSVMPGNHDMLGSGPPSYTRNATLYNANFPVSRFASKPWYGGHYGSTNESNYSLFSAGGMDFLMLNLELMPSDDTLTWANGVLDAYPTRRTIVATHKYLTEAGDRSTQTVYGSFTGNNANQIFDELITNHSNVFMVVCGHESAERLRVATNAAGKPVYEILTDYQDLANGGNGWLRTLQFKPDTNEIAVGSYSPVLDQYNIGTWGGPYTLTYDMGGTGPTIPSGPAASLVAHWALDDGQTIPSTTTAVDATSPASNGTLRNMSVPSAWVNGRFGKALDFDGTNDRIDMNAPAELNLTGDLSMSFWVKPDGTGAATYGPLVGKNLSGGASNDGYSTDITYSKSVTGAIVGAGTLEFAITEGGALTVVRSSSALSLTDGTWHHVAVTFQAGQRMAIYLDGELSGQLTTGVPETCAATATQFALGNLADGSTVDNYCYSGGLDDVWLFEGVLTETQIGRLMAGTSPFVPGDANSDGWIDGEDAAILAENWGVTNAEWGMGDFDGDAVIGPRDASILAANWLPQGAEAGQTVPEPSLGVLLCAATMALVWRRRTK